MKAEELGWAAGFFEGEGCLSIALTANGFFHGGVSASQNTREPLDRLVELFGGQVYQKSSSGYEWCLNSKKALPFLRKIYPHIISPLRKREIAIYTAFYSTTNRDARCAHLNWWKQRKEVSNEQSMGL